MITVEEAQALLQHSIAPATAVSTSLDKACGSALAADIFAPCALPLFDQSAMDGYVIATDAEDRREFVVRGEIRAGDDISKVQMQEGDAWRIFTGAAFPPQGDAIVIQEKVERTANTILLSEPFKRNTYIRRKGTQLIAGQLLMHKHDVLNPGAIGLLASLGLTSVEVFRTPSISLLVTGDETKAAGTVLEPGQIYESNSVMLTAALHQMGLGVSRCLHATDTELDTVTKIAECRKDADIIIITGGISVGEYDFVHAAMQKHKVEPLFYKVAQKPGKPLFAGRCGHQWIFALPGNPASALVCFYEYVYPSIRSMMGFRDPFLARGLRRLAKPVNKADGRAEFIRSRVEGGEVTPLEGQDSGMLLSFAQANALIYLPASKPGAAVQDEVVVHFLPQN